MKNRKLLIVTHYYATGPAQELRQYFIARKYSFEYREYPFHYAKRGFPIKETYINGKLKKRTKGLALLKNEYFYYLRDFISNLLSLKKVDIAFGFDNLNTFALLILKKFGIIKKVVFITVDYSPKRFKNTILDNLYHAIDKYCCYNADILWDSAEAMKPARIRFHKMDSKRIRPILVVDDGNQFDVERIRKLTEIEKYRMVFMGHLREKQGLHMLLDAYFELNKWNPKIKLSIFGDGPMAGSLKKIAERRNLDIYFSGYIQDDEKMKEQLRNAYLAFALYENDENSFSKYSAVGKPKIYMGCGLPVIITGVPEISKKIEESGGGIIVPFEKNAIIETVKGIINNEQKYKFMRERAIEFANNNTWDKIFDTAIEKTIKAIT